MSRMAEMAREGPQEGPRKSIQSVDRALSLLEILAAENGEASLQTLSRKAGLNRTTAYRLLRALQSHDMIQQNPTSRHYRLGLKLLGLAAAVRSQLDIRQHARPALERLAVQSGETANLAIREGTEAVYIDQVSSSHPIRAFTQVGARVPLHCTGVGKVLLAYLTEEDLSVIAAQDLTKYTSQTIGDWRKLRDELNKIRASGWALDAEEMQPEVRCIAAPVFDDQGRVVAAISIAAPAQRLTGMRQHELAPVVRRAGADVSLALGFSSGKANEARGQD